MSAPRDKRATTASIEATAMDLQPLDSIPTGLTAPNTRPHQDAMNLTMEHRVKWLENQLNFVLPVRFRAVEQVHALESKLHDMTERVAKMEKHLCHCADVASQEPMTPESMDRELGAETVRTSEPVKEDEGGMA
ncbi:hypothetical protein LEL_09024 [Akanthomyces lecanii RCEF 1005]|uniref:Uncharacterized protein n=1 Tax=Akanthomyces lecanii RCEF 1005 TaxID=1081108 RepID=A0A162MWQ8_CORDF|nr:hypothetical protein LEL_09024 [Akanthomyces lecanii RCEF 1005]